MVEQAVERIARIVSTRAMLWPARRRWAARKMKVSRSASTAAAMLVRRSTSLRAESSSARTGRASRQMPTTAATLPSPSTSGRNSWNDRTGQTDRGVYRLAVLDQTCCGLALKRKRGPTPLIDQPEAPARSLSSRLPAASRHSTWSIHSAGDQGGQVCLEILAPLIINGARAQISGAYVGIGPESDQGPVVGDRRVKNGRREMRPDHECEGRCHAGDESSERRRKQARAASAVALRAKFCGSATACPSAISGVRNTLDNKHRRRSIRRRWIDGPGGTSARCAHAPR